MSWSWSQPNSMSHSSGGMIWPIIPVPYCLCCNHSRCPDPGPSQTVCPTPLVGWSDLIIPVPYCLCCSHSRCPDPGPSQTVCPTPLVGWSDPSYLSHTVYVVATPDVLIPAKQYVPLLWWDDLTSSYLSHTVYVVTTPDVLVLIPAKQYVPLLWRDDLTPRYGRQILLCIFVGLFITTSCRWGKEINLT